MAVRATIRDVAKRAEVSISTVSNYLNGNYGNMSVRTRDRVAEAIETLRYFPSLGAQALPRKRKTRTVCIVIPHDVDYTFHHTYFAEVMRGISQVFDSRSFRAMILTIKDRNPKEIAYLRGLTRGIVDGILFFDLEERDPFVQEFGTSSIPVMFVGRVEEGVTRYVDNDVENGAAEATRHLLELGHRRIGLLAGPESLMFTRQLVAGYLAACETAGDPAQGRVVYGDFSEASGLNAARSLYEGHPDTTAIFAASGKQAVGFLEYARRVKLAVPADVSLVSFGHHPVVGLRGESLTYVDQPEVEVGILVAAKLLDQIDDPRQEVRPEVLPLRLVVGDSTGPPRKGR